MDALSKTNLWKGIHNLLQKSVSHVPGDLIKELEGLKQHYRKENNARILSQLDLMIENLSYSAETGLPNCQDTGIPTFFIQLGLHSPFSSILEAEINKALIYSTKTGILRPNSVDPITEENPGNNTGLNTPPVYYDINDSDEIVITVLNKGGGAENCSALFMLNPSDGIEVAKQKIINRIRESGGKPCPPIIVGVGLGGDAVKSMFLAKKSLLRPLLSPNHRKDIADFEKDLLTQINALNIGVMGLGGRGTCLAVHCEVAMRHPASFPVGMIVQCYSHRMFSMRIQKDGSVIYGRLDDKYNFVKEE
jgi:fumarate hydratase subunit alpha